MKLFKSIIVALLAIVICSSCGFRKIPEQIDIKGFTTLDLKGMTGLRADAYIVNDSRHEITMREGEVTLFYEDRRAILLTQVGEATLPALSEGDVKTLWKISNVDARAIPTLLSLLRSRDFNELEISYSARFSTKGMSRTISQENVNLQNFMTIFAK